jgi:hypothetical protein
VRCSQALPLAVNVRHDWTAVLLSLVVTLGTCEHCVVLLSCVILAWSHLGSCTCLSRTEAIQRCTLLTVMVMTQCTVGWSGMLHMSALLHIVSDIPAS